MKSQQFGERVEAGRVIGHPGMGAPYRVEITDGIRRQIMELADVYAKSLDDNDRARLEAYVYRLQEPGPHHHLEMLAYRFQKDYDPRPNQEFLKKCKGLVTAEEHWESVRNSTTEEAGA